MARLPTHHICKALLTLLLAGTAGCDGRHPLYDKVAVPIQAPPPPPAAQLLPLDAQQRCEAVLEQVFVPLAVSVGEHGKRAVAARVAGDRCLLLVGSGNGDQRELAGAAVLFQLAQVDVANLLPADLAQFADCLPASDFRIVAQCPAGSIGLP